MFSWYMQHICLLAYCQLERNRERERKREREREREGWLGHSFGIYIERHKWFLWCWLCMCFLVGVRYTKSMLPVFLFLNRIRKRKENRNEFGHIMHENVTYNDNHTHVLRFVFHCCLHGYRYIVVQTLSLLHT